MRGASVEPIMTKCAKAGGKSLGTSGRLHSRSPLRLSGIAVTVYAGLDWLLRALSTMTLGHYVTLGALVSILLMLVWSRRRAWRLLLVVLILSEDIAPGVFRAKSATEAANIRFFTIYRDSLGSLRVIHYLVLLIFAATALWFLAARCRMLFDRYVLLLGLLALQRAFIGVTNLEDYTSLEAYISDLYPLMGFLIFYMFGRAAMLNGQPDSADLQLPFVLLQAKALSYLLESVWNYVTGRGTLTHLAPDTLSFAFIAFSLFYLVLWPAGMGSLYDIVVSVLSAVGALLMWIGQPGSALMIIVGCCGLISVVLSLRLGLFRELARNVVVAASAFAVILVLMVSTGFMRNLQTLLLHKWSNIISLVSMDPKRFSPTVAIRYAELVNITDKLSADGVLALLAGQGAGSYFTYRVVPPPPEVYSQVGSYLPEQLESGRFFFAHDFVNSMLLKNGILGLLIYLLAFAMLVRKLYRAITCVRMSNYGIRVCLILLALSPGFLYNLHWSVKVAMVTGLLLALAEVVGMSGSTYCTRGGWVSNVSQCDLHRPK